MRRMEQQAARRRGWRLKKWTARGPMGLFSGGKAGAYRTVIFSRATGGVVQVHLRADETIGFNIQNLHGMPFPEERMEMFKEIAIARAATKALTEQDVPEEECWL